MSFYDNSPGMVDDIPPAVSTPPADAAPEPGKPAPAAGPAAPPAAAPAPKPAAPAAAPDAAGRVAAVAELEKDADGLPLGSDVGVALTRAAAELGQDEASAAAVASEWLDTFKAHGIAQGDAHDCISAAMTIERDGIPDEDTEAAWLPDVQERLAREFGGQEAGERAADLARAFVARDPALLAYLERTRLGSHPRVVLAIAKAAHKAANAGKWRPK